MTITETNRELTLKTWLCGFFLSVKFATSLPALLAGILHSLNVNQNFTFGYFIYFFKIESRDFNKILIHLEETLESNNT